MSESLWSELKRSMPQLVEAVDGWSLDLVPTRTIDVDGSKFTIPSQWSDNAGRICATRYANKAIGETSAFQVIMRVARGLSSAAVRHKYVTITRDWIDLRSMIEYTLVYQIAAPNSPQWFNQGLDLVGLNVGKSNGWVYNPDTDECFQPDRKYQYPQLHACFINSVEDTMIGDGGIMDLWARETQIFKFGSGAGSNVSAIRERGAPLSGGGQSSGVMSFLSVGDRNAGAIKSGGTTRRAALMRTLDIDHPDIVDFIRWKRTEEAKVAYLIEGSKALANATGESTTQLDPAIAERLRQMDAQGILAGEFAPMDVGWTSEAYATVDGQNSNNSVMISDAFMRKLLSAGADRSFDLLSRVDGSVVRTVNVDDVWRELCEAAWLSADPAVQFEGTINAANTAANDGKIVATNPCCFIGSTLVLTTDGPIAIEELERMAFDDEPLPTAVCFDEESGQSTTSPIMDAWCAGRTTDSELVRVTTTSGKSFYCTHDHRWLLANGTWVEAADLADGDELQTAGDNPLDFEIIDSVVGVRRKMKVYDIEVENFHNFAIVEDDDDDRPIVVHNSEYVYLDDTACNLASINLDSPWIREGDGLKRIAEVATLWTMLLDLSVEMASYPTAKIAKMSYEHRTLGLGFTGLGARLARMGIPYEHDDAVDHAQGVMHTIYHSALRCSRVMAKHLGACAAYGRNVDHVRRVVEGKTNEMDGGVPIRNMQLTAIAPTGTISFIMDAESTGIEPVYALSIHKSLAEGGSMTMEAGFVRDGVKNAIVRQGLEGHYADAGAIDQLVQQVMDGTAPPEIQNVFKTANEISWFGHLDMMAAVQQYTCGAISKTVNLPADATVDDISNVYKHAYEMGIKCVSVYRDGSKLSQPLTANVAPKVGIGDGDGDAQAKIIDRVVDEWHGVIDLNQTAPTRRRMPSRRSGYTQKVNVDGQSIYYRTGDYEDGTLGELFIDMNKDGSTVGGLVSSFAKAVSIGLQHGVPLDTFVRSFKGTRFAPSGFTLGHDDIKSCASVIDLVMRDLEAAYGDVRKFDVDRSHQSELPVVEVRTSSINTNNIPQQPRYTGDECPECGSVKMVATGVCSTCRDCGVTTGCG